jgi:hypothetical protein
VRPRLLKAVQATPGGRTAESIVRLRRFEGGLRGVNDVLSTTPIDARYWMWGGTMLGYAREGAVLRHDLRDADFACLDEDWPRLLDSIPALVNHAFQPLERFRNNAGVITQLTFLRQGVNFDFFRLWKEREHFTYFEYFGWGRPDVSPIEMAGEVPLQDRVPFSFLSRSWLKVEDHERELEALYGDWRVPQTEWQGDRDRPAIVRRRPWIHPSPAWDGDLSSQ